MSESKDTIKVLFLCTGNSARSILAEVILNARGGDRFRGYSAGSHPTGKVHPGARAELEIRDHDASGVRSKSWDEFAGPGAPEFRFVLTVCDNAANEACPVWRGSPVTVHWGIPDPAAVRGPGDAVRRAFRSAYERLARRIESMLELPIDSMDDVELRAALQALGDADL